MPTAWQWEAEIRVRETFGLWYFCDMILLSDFLLHCHATQYDSQEDHLSLFRNLEKRFKSVWSVSGVRVSVFFLQCNFV